MNFKAIIFCVIIAVHISLITIGIAETQKLLQQSAERIKEGPAEPVATERLATPIPYIYNTMHDGHLFIVYQSRLYPHPDCEKCLKRKSSTSTSTGF